MKKNQSEEKMKNYCIENKKNFIGILLLLFFTIPSVSFGQYNVAKWLSVGSLQNYYNGYGCEIEEGRVKEQQDGWQWPAIYNNQDAQAAKGFWIAVKNFSSEYPYKVAQVGPRLNGVGEFFPYAHKLISKIAAPIVTVDGVNSYNKKVTIEEIDPSIPCDRMIVNAANTITGITMTRKLMQFAVPNHDNYIVMDYWFKNTGYTDGTNTVDPALKDKTLEGVYFYWQYRWAPTKQVDNIIANGTRWGMNTMNDVRGDSVYSGDLASESKYRTIFAWHGYFPDKTVKYDNIGGPVWYGTSGAESGFETAADTVGRLGAAQFVGVVTLHADKSASDKSDDTKQPTTTMYMNSDDAVLSGDATSNNAYNEGLMMNKYNNYVSVGHQTRHAYKVQPDGKFETQKTNPSLGNTAGNSSAIGFGPYTIAPGDSVHIVIAEGSAGLSREACLSVGRTYMNEYNAANGVAAAQDAAALKKNKAVLTGKDSLMKTWDFALANYNSGYNVATSTPLPPKTFDVTSKGNMITLAWTSFNSGTAPVAYRIYRAGYQSDSTYYLIHEATTSETSYDDVNLIRGISYYYYITAVGADGSESSRYYTQTFNAATLKRPAGTSMDEIRVVPNPYIISSDGNTLRFGEVDRPNQIAFFGIPGNCTIKIYDELGRLIATPDSPETGLKQRLHHTDGSGDAYWNCNTTYGQIVVSGIYIAVVTNNDTGAKKIVKFVVIR
jgi:hypothetical protein